MFLFELWGITLALTICVGVGWSCFGELFSRWEFDHQRVHLWLIGLFSAFTIVTIIYGNFIR